MKEYFQIEGSYILHLFPEECHYIKNTKNEITLHSRRHGDFRVCDQCQRIAKRAHKLGADE